MTNLATTNYLNLLLDKGNTWEQALESLNLTYGIKARIHDDYGLIVLNYCQIESARVKTDQIVRECRSLVVTIPNRPHEVPAGIEKGTEEHYFSQFQVVSRAFDRFFNYTETESSTELECHTLSFAEKLAGSLVTLFHHNGQWLYRTKSVIMPVDMTNNHGNLWKDMIEEAINWNTVSFDALSPSHSYILEVVSPENRIVTPYAETKGVLLAARSVDGIYAIPWTMDICAEHLGWSRPQLGHYETFEDAIEAANTLPDRKEGYVGYNTFGIPVTKIKSQTYIRFHHLRGEGVLTPKRVLGLIQENEVDEYVTAFPEDAEIINGYKDTLDCLLAGVTGQYYAIGNVRDNKEYAMLVKDLPCKHLLFSMRNHGLTSRQAFDNLFPNQQVDLLVEAKENLN